MYALAFRWSVLSSPSWPSYCHHNQTLAVPEASSDASLHSAHTALAWVTQNLTYLACHITFCNGRNMDFSRKTGISSLTFTYELALWFEKVNFLISSFLLFKTGTLITSKRLLSFRWNNVCECLQHNTWQVAGAAEWQLKPYDAFLPMVREGYWARTVSGTLYYKIPPALHLPVGVTTP